MFLCFKCHDNSLQVFITSVLCLATKERRLMKGRVPNLSQGHPLELQRRQNHCKGEFLEKIFISIICLIAFSFLMIP